jgi:RIO kinase 1
VLTLRFLIRRTPQGATLRFLLCAGCSTLDKRMKLSINSLDEEDLDEPDFAKIRSRKPRLKGRQSVTQLVARSVDPSDPFSRFESPDLNELCRAGHLDELITGIKTGKEASVFLGRNADGFVAVKVYTDLRVRSFRRDQAYREGRYIGDVRIEKAIAQGSQRGLEAHQALWVWEEYTQMQHLYRHGVRVPKAIAVHGNTLVMEFIGDETGHPAPRLSDLHLDLDEAQEAFRQSLHNLKLIVSAGRVHGDYSTFNILWHAGQAVVIDFPQVMQPGQNRHAESFLARDVRSLCSSFRKLGIQADEVRTLRDARSR